MPGHEKNLDLQHIDEVSLARAIQLLESGAIDTLEVGTTRGLQQIHRALFGGLYEFAGQIRTVNLAKGDFRFANCLYLGRILAAIEKMPRDSLEEIVARYIEMNIAHPFREGNGRAMRLWLDAQLRHRLQLVVDWHHVGKDAYFQAMERSPVSAGVLLALVRANLTDRVEDHDVLVQGLEQSWSFEGLSKTR